MRTTPRVDDKLILRMPVECRVYPMVGTEIIPAVYLKIENKPGTLEHASRILGERRINLDAVGLETVGALGYARFLTKKPGEAVEALRSMSVEAYQSEVVLAHLPNKPGELARACSALAAARVNVESVVGMPDGRLAFRTSDNETAARILGKL